MIKKFLKYINSMPFPFTMRHYQVFGGATAKMKDQELTSLASWDTLRQEHPHFSIPTDRNEWLFVSEANVKKDGQDSLLVSRALDIVKLIQREKVKKVFSVGVGGAGLEYQIKKNMPEVNMVCSEYSPTNVELLKKVFLESNGIIQFDIFKDDWNPINDKYLKEEGLCLIYRVDASFNDKEWRKIFSDMYEAGVRKVLFIPTGVLTILSVFNRKLREVKWFLRKTPKVFCGHIRTKKRFETYWRGFYDSEDISLGGLKSFLLKIKKNNY